MAVNKLRIGWRGGRVVIGIIEDLGKHPKAPVHLGSESKVRREAVTP
jgi:hypothetical protein